METHVLKKKKIYSSLCVQALECVTMWTDVFSRAQTPTAPVSPAEAVGRETLSHVTSTRRSLIPPVRGDRNTARCSMNHRLPAPPRPTPPQLVKYGSSSSRLHPHTPGLMRHWTGRLVQLNFYHSILHWLVHSSAVLPVRWGGGG